MDCARVCDNIDRAPSSFMSPLPDFFRPLVVSGPSGVGKGTLIKRLFSEFPNKFGFSISRLWLSSPHIIQLITSGADTTRAPRAGENDGIDYYFVTAQQFVDLRQNGGFIETAEFSGNFYGTSKQAVRDVAQTGRRCILDIEAQVCFLSVMPSYVRFRMSRFI